VDEAEEADENDDENASFDGDVGAETKGAVAGDETIHQGANENDEDDADSVGAVRRRSTRRRTKRSALVVDFDNHAYSVTDAGYCTSIRISWLKQKKTSRSRAKISLKAR
jgi:hypothetical protein